MLYFDLESDLNLAIPKVCEFTQESTKSEIKFSL